MSAPRTAMVLAAGLGTRMRPLTDATPKALVKVAGKALIDHVLDRLAATGVTTAVVNVHHFADQMEAHLAGRRTPRVLISDERSGLLDSGGGIARALPMLGEGPIFIANIDTVWIEHGTLALTALADAWDPARMDICVLLAPRANTYGFDRPEGFLRDEAGRLTHSNCADPLPPYANIGFQILKPEVLAPNPEGPFSILPIWKRLAAQGRLSGAVTGAYVMHVSDPEALAATEARLAVEALG